MSSPNRPSKFSPILREHSTGSTTSGGKPSTTKSKGATPNHPATLHMRSDSSGSMRGAFYQGHLPAVTAAPSSTKRQTSGQRRSASSPQLHNHHAVSIGGSSRKQQHQQQHQYENQDLAQLAAMAMVSPPDSEQQTQYQNYVHPFQAAPSGQGSRVLKEEPAPGRWDSMRGESTYSELLLMLSSTQDSLPDEELEGAYGSMQQQQQQQQQTSRRQPWDPLQFTDPHDSAASPLLGAAVSHDVQSQRPPSSYSAQAYSRIQQQQQILPENAATSRHSGPLLISSPIPPPPPLVTTDSDGRRSSWSRSQQPSPENIYYAYADQRQQEEIALFASLATPSQQEYLSPHGPIQTTNKYIPHSPQYFSSPKKMGSISFHENHHHDDDDDRSSQQQPSTVEEYDDEYLDENEEREEEEEDEHKDQSCWGILNRAWSRWLSAGVKWDDDGTPYFEDEDHWTSLSAWVRFIVYNPVYPEFTSVQQAFWAVFIGIVMGFFTAIWKIIIETCVNFMWKTVPETLLSYGVFTDLNGHFPLPYYMILCPAFCGCVLSYINVIIPVKIPGQNEWIQDVHTRGVHDATAFWYMFALSTGGMASGMSIGPEGPLVTIGGMFGSKLGVITKQSILQARVLNLTAASATVGGFFGFPMAGALFVLELPHRMGLQYFEALTPATVSTIVAVLTNRMVMKNDVTGYYSYPFMNTTLPSRIFVNAICYGAFGALIGMLYAKGVVGLKGRVHEFFHAPDNHHQQTESNAEHPSSADLNRGYHHHLGEESLPLVGDGHKKMTVKSRTRLCSSVLNCFRSICKCVIPHEPTRAAVVGLMAGGTVGFIGMFLPHIMFWGEEQLQNLIDKGRTPLPVFLRDDESISALTAYGWCMIDPKDPQAVSAGFSMGCSSLLVFCKIFCTGLSFGTGLPGGHFWGPLFCGCAASHFLTDLTTWTEQHWGLGGQIAAYPCVSILCVMGSTHVVTFRAHTAIMLILTLTISAFNPENEVGVGSYKVAGDYSAVFPLLVVAVYVSFILSRDTVFYKAQRSRGDIMALPEVLCEPGKVGQPLVVNYDGHVDFQEEGHDQDHDYQSVSNTASRSGEKNQYHSKSLTRHQKSPSPTKKGYLDPSGIMKNDNEDELEVKNSFSSTQQGTAGSGNGLDWDVSKDSIDPIESYMKSNSREPGNLRSLHSESFPEQDEESPGVQARLDELLSRPLERQSSKYRNFHRRSQSAPIEHLEAPPTRRNRRDHLVRSASSEKKHLRTDSRDTILESGSQRERSNSGTGRALVRVISFGEVTNDQPSLLDQARGRSATNSAAESRHHRLPSLPKISATGRHARWGSDSSSVISATMASLEASTGALNSDDIERTFSSKVNELLLQARRG